MRWLRLTSHRVHSIPTRLLPDPHLIQLTVKLGLLFRQGLVRKQRWARHKPTPALEDGSEPACLSAAGLPPKPLLRPLCPRKPPWNLLCGPGPLPQQPIPGTNDSGFLEPPSLSINKIKRKPRWQQASSRHRRHGLEGSRLPRLRAPSGLGHSWLHLARQRSLLLRAKDWSQLPHGPFAFG